MPYELLDSSQKYEEETYEEVTSRYKLFGSDFYKFIKENAPFIFSKLKFYRATELLEKVPFGRAETENSYAIYDDGEKTFTIQLEPLTEVICLNNFITHIELGDWDSNDYYVESLNFIKEKFL